MGVKVVSGQVEFLLESLALQGESGVYLTKISARGTNGRALEDLMIWIQRVTDELADRLPPRGTTALRFWASRADLVTGEIVVHAMYRDGAAVQKTSTRVVAAVGSNGFLAPQLADPSPWRPPTLKDLPVTHRVGRA